MADAPAPSGGGSNWGPFEIILALLLTISLIATIRNGGKITPATEGIKQAKEAASTPAPSKTNNTCGLSVTSPLSLQKVSESVRLAGSVNGCNWNPQGQTALYAQVVDATGAPVSAFTTIPALENGFMTTGFDASIELTSSPTGTGYLILIPAVQKEKSITVRIPLQFIRK